MDSAELEKVFRKIVSETLDLEEQQVVDDLARDDTGEWDSFNHLVLISNLEEALGVSFTMAEVESARTLSDLKAMLVKKKSS